tara:strand:- start:816 stop:1157 length:342 start_codon:yes stop_codon:yes gene_type:complete
MLDTILLIAVVVVLILCIFAFPFVLSRALNEVRDSMTPPEQQKLPDFNALRNDLMDLVTDTISTMQPPNAMDHLLGMLTQFAQMKMMQSTGIDPSSMIGHITEMGEGLNDPPE